MQGLGSVEDMWKAWSNMIKGKAFRQHVILMQSIDGPTKPKFTLHKKHTLTPTCAPMIIMKRKLCPLATMPLLEPYSLVQDLDGPTQHSHTHTYFYDIQTNQ